MVVGAGSARAEDEAPLVTDVVYAKEVRLVEVEPGRRLNLHCLGQGSTTVVFESGAGGGMTAWSPVHKDIAAHTRACAYDRAGRNFSDPSPHPSTSANIAADLHRLMAAAGEKPPYVLVGHSLGGLAVRSYADAYPEEVAGLVLVDPMHEDQSELYRALDPAKASREAWEQQREPRFARIRACRDAAAAGFTKDTEVYKTCSIGEPDPLYSAEINAAYMQLEVKPAYWQGFLSEHENAFTASADEVRASRHSYGALPLVVLTRAPAPRGAKETQAVRDERNAVWVRMHQDIVRLSSRGEHRVIADSSHAIQFDQPAAVVKAVLDVVRMAQPRDGTEP